MYRRRQIRIVFPPVQPDLLRFIHGTHQQTNPNRQQFNVRQRNTDVSGDYQALVEDPVQDVEQIGCAGYARDTFHKSVRATSVLNVR